MVNYEEYLEIVYPKKREADIKDKEQRAAENEKLKKIRIEKMNKFVNKGEPGEIFHDDYHNILKKMKVPDEVLAKVKNGETDEPQTSYPIHLATSLTLFPPLPPVHPVHSDMPEPQSGSPALATFSRHATSSLRGACRMAHHTERARLAPTASPHCLRSRKTAERALPHARPYAAAGHQHRTLPGPWKPARCIPCRPREVC